MGSFGIVVFSVLLGLPGTKASAFWAVFGQLDSAPSSLEGSCIKRAESSDDAHVEVVSYIPSGDRMQT